MFLMCFEKWLSYFLYSKAVWAEDCVSPWVLYSDSPVSPFP